MVNIMLLTLASIFMAVAVAVMKRLAVGGYVRIIASVGVFVFLALSGFYIVSDNLTGEGINEAVYYHLSYGLHGAGFREYRDLIIGIAVLAGASAAASVFVYRYLIRGPRAGSTVRDFLGLALLIPPFFINPVSSDFVELYRNQMSGNPGISSDPGLSEFYVTPTSLASQSSPINVVYIYVESLDYAYFDEARFPGLVPGLKSLQKDSINFTGIRQLPNTGWTIGGITASQCGIPLAYTSGWNSMGGMDAFLPGAVCIGDLLKQQGYSLNYLGGASLKFAGKGKFYKTHGFKDVRGREELKSRVNGNYLTGWGLYDDTLFDIAAERFFELAKESDPFALFLLTLDTHGPNGDPSASCADRPYRDGDNPILNAVHCSDLLVTKFVRQIRKSEYGNNTLIVVGSDHLAMNNTVYDKLKKMERRNLFFVLSPKDVNSASIDKPGSAMDIGPTLLSLMGYDTNEFGFGRDLMRQKPTIIEAFTNPNKWVSRQIPSLLKLWEFPNLDYGLLVDSKRKNIRFGDRVVEAPALIMLDGELNVRAVRFEFYLKDNLVGFVSQFAEADVDQPMFGFEGAEGSGESIELNTGETANKYAAIMVHHDGDVKYLRIYDGAG